MRSHWSCVMLSNTASCRTMAALMQPLMPGMPARAHSCSIVATLAADDTSQIGVMTLTPCCCSDRTVRAAAGFVRGPERDGMIRFRAPLVAIH